MKIHVSMSAAELATMVLKKLYHDSIIDKTYISYILNNDLGYKTQLKFYSGKITLDQYIDVLVSSINNQKYITDNDVLKRMNSSFLRISQNLELLDKKLDRIKSFDFEGLENKLNNTLPQGTEFDFNIFICLDGYNFGSIVDNHTMCLDILFWPSEKSYEKEIEGIILHEFHHIGMLYWLNKNKRRFDILSNKNNISLAIKLVESIMSEGAAVYFFNESEGLYELVREAYGEELYANSREKYFDSWSDIDIKMDNFINLLSELLTSHISEYNRFKNTVSKYFFMNNNEEALNKVIGQYMCSLIDKVLGRAALIKSFKDTKVFLNYYNIACKKISKQSLDDDLIRKWNDIW